MLEYLHVKNLALIKEAELLLSGNLNILSGETGAGKSVLLGSVNLALGARADKTLIRTNAPYALIELRFRVDEPEVLENLRSLGVEPEDGELILSRKILPDRSFARLQGEIVNVSLLSKVSELLINVHGQHDHQMLLRDEMHVHLLDSYGKETLDEAKKSYIDAYWKYRAKKEALNALGGGSEEERQARMDFLEFQISEIENAGLNPDEEEQIRGEYRLLSDAQKIQETLNTVDYLLSGSASDNVTEAVRLSMSLKEYTPGLKDLSDALSSLESLLSDTIRETRSQCLSNETNEERLHMLEARLALINSLKRKHGGSIQSVLHTLDILRSEYKALTSFNENKARIEEELKELRTTLVHEGRKLHEERVSQAERFSGEMEKALSELNFLSVRFHADVSLTTHYSKDGADNVRFMISTNPGEELKPLSKVASGGELSRIMLAIRTIISDSDHVGTLIFDEIDTGISGKTGAMVAKKLREIARRHQVICISHLPQIVSMADHHYLIEKNISDGETVTTIQPLNEEESLNALAGLLGGGEVTESSLENAREMRRRLKEDALSEEEEENGGR